MKYIDVLEVLEVASAGQWGIVTTAQAEREGITRLQLGRLAEKGILTRVRRGIYLLPSAQYGPLTDIHVAWVSLGAGQFPDERWAAAEGIVVSHESAALIHGIGDLIPGKLTFSSVTRKQTSQDDIHIYSNREISPGEIANIDGLPVTSVERTTADLAGKKIEFNYLATMVVDALRKEGVRVAELSSRLDDAASGYGFTAGRELVRACLDDAETEEDRQERLDRFAAAFKTAVVENQAVVFGGIPELDEALRNMYAQNAVVVDSLAKLQGALGGIFAEQIGGAEAYQSLANALEASGMTENLLRPQPGNADTRK